MSCIMGNGLHNSIVVAVGEFMDKMARESRFPYSRPHKLNWHNRTNEAAGVRNGPVTEYRLNERRSWRRWAHDTTPARLTRSQLPP